MIDALLANTQLLHQLEHRDHIASGADAVGAADSDHVRLTALNAELLVKLTQLRRALRAINPVFPGVEETVEQQISVWQVRLLAVQNQLAFEPSLRRRRSGL